MQCSMHLETAFTFRTTCLETETKFQNHNNRIMTRGNKMKLETQLPEEQKQIKLFCQQCKVHFSTENIFVLHMNVMHARNEFVPKQEQQECPDINSKLKSHQKSDNPLFQMIFTQPKIEASVEKHDDISSVNSQSRTSNGILQKITSPKCKLAKTDSPDIKIPVKRIKIDSNNRPKRRIVKVQENSVEHELNTTPDNIDVESETTQTSPPFCCRFCPKQFEKSGPLSCHISHCHKDKCVRCMLCHRFYTNWKMHRKQYGCQLQNLQKEHESDLMNISFSEQNNEKLYYIYTSRKHPMCLICRRICASIGELTRHITSKHPRRVKCKLCFKEFSATKYCSHMGQGCCRLVRESTFNYTKDGECICPLCNKVFPDRAVLKSHMARHMGDNLQCKICREQFNKITVYCKHIVKGCSKNVPSTDNLPQNESVFIKTEHEFHNNTLSSTNKDPLHEEISFTADLHNRSVKIEPTELLDQTGFIISEDSRNADDELNQSEPNQESEEYLDVNEDETVVRISPELVYSLHKMGETSE